jgi:transposase InsO family protein
MALRTAIQEIALAHHGRYGYRRVTAELHRRGMAVNHKRVLRLMRSDNLLAVRFRKFVLTTDSQHHCQVYVNLASRMTLSGVNQLWVADITYIRLRTEFVFLAVVMDRFSRKAIGWALDRSLAARVAVAALQQAITHRRPPPGVVHHSDQGIQYACADYVAALKTNGMLPSMSRPGIRPWDTARRRSLSGTPRPRCRAQSSMRRPCSSSRLRSPRQNHDKRTGAKAKFARNRETLRTTGR